LFFLRRFVVYEIIVAFLDPLPLPRHPESRPVIPFVLCIFGLHNCNADRRQGLPVPRGRSAVDGAQVPTFMASPSYLAFALPPGQHFVVAEYRSTPIKSPLLALGVVVLAGTGAAGVGRRRLETSPARVRSLWRTLHAQWSQKRGHRD